MSKAFLAVAFSTIGLTVGVGVGVGVGDGVLPTAPIGSLIAVGIGVGVAFFIAAPLFHTNFFPDLTQVYLIPEDVLVWPTFLHVVPGFTAAIAID